MPATAHRALSTAICKSHPEIDCCWARTNSAKPATAIAALARVPGPRATTWCCSTPIREQAADCAVLQHAAHTAGWGSRAQASVSDGRTSFRGGARTSYETPEWIQHRLCRPMRQSTRLDAARVELHLPRRVLYFARRSFARWSARFRPIRWRSRMSTTALLHGAAILGLAITRRGRVHRKRPRAVGQFGALRRASMAHFWSKKVLLRSRHRPQRPAVLTHHLCDGQSVAGGARPSCFINE
jgi:hypothetical protein